MSARISQAADTAEVFLCELLNGQTVSQSVLKCRLPDF